MKIEIKNVKGEVIFSHKCEENTIRKVVEAAIEQEADLRYADLIGANLRAANLCGSDLIGANLRAANLRDANLSAANLIGANLRYANLSDADLGGANLGWANLRGTDLSGADLGGANLSGANLRDANLRGANLRGTNLRDANLSGANLSGANLRYANLSYADLSYANLSDADLGGANLSDANLSGANLNGADLDNVVFNERTSFFSMQCPEEGSFIGWKVASEKIVKLLITEDSKRSSATSLKCRCSKAMVLDIQEVDGSPSLVDEVRSDYDDSFIYKIGEVIEVDDFDENRWDECSTGIHFFASRDMAVRYY